VAQGHDPALIELTTDAGDLPCHLGGCAVAVQSCPI
jgi:hypothetical protein